MQSKRIVVDANILIRAVLGVRVRELIERYCDTTAFYVAEANVEEAEQYLSEIAPRRSIDERVWRESFAALLTAVQVIPQDQLVVVQREAAARIGPRDPDDWQAVAGALQFDCPIWTEDDDFFGSGVATWTTRTVEIFLEGD